MIFLDSKWQVIAFVFGLSSCIKILKIKRLGRQYETNCREYGQDYDYETSGDCHTLCLKYHHKIACNDTSLPWLPSLARQEYVNVNYNKSINSCEASSEIEKGAMINCSKHCNHDCQYKLYPADMMKFSEHNQIHSRNQFHIIHLQLRWSA